MASVISKRRINKHRVAPIKGKGKVDERPVLGADLFPEVYAQIFICAKKKSGKTVVIQDIIKECADPKQTSVIAFCSTITKDQAWLDLASWCKKRKLHFQGFPSILEDKVDRIQRFINKLEEEGDDRDIDDSDEEYDSEASSQEDFFASDSDSYSSEYSDDDLFEGVNRKQKIGLENEVGDRRLKKLFDRRRERTSLVPKSKFRAPEYILIFDDLSHQLRLPSMVSLMKKNRHFKCKVIVSSQWPNDLKPEQIKQMDYILVFRSMSEEKLKKLRTDGDLAIEEEDLLRIYHDATKDPYNFLYIDTRNEQYRKNFDEMYNIQDGKLNEDNIQDNDKAESE